MTMRVAVLLLGAVLPVAAQEPPRFPADVELVYLTISAQDKQGRPLSDLKPEEITIKEDGKARAVSVLAPVGAAETNDHTAVDGCLLVDTSGSVAGMTEKLTEAALRLLAQLPKLRHRCVLSFDNDVRVWRGDAEPAALARDIMAARAANGATALNTALATAVEQMGSGRGRAVLLLVSDGDDVGSRVTQADALAAVQGSRFVVYPITHAAPVTMSLSPGARAGQSPLRGGNTGVNSWGANARFTGPAYLSRLAEMTGGRVFGPRDGGVEDVFQQLAAEIAAQYVVGFAPASGYPGPHKLKLAVSRKDVRLRHKAAFIVRPEPLPQAH